ncbi:hypothetical protein [Halochromatium roseum]|uniref:hypothetical protein n=1 Tax=Halochromatium roseum TaxID=391920 RepID=UPI001914A8E5|nr:hypothetical protein [Halochromatium roseum]MBK5938303.1 hypothetical protein [Halochromatium roseum]
MDTGNAEMQINAYNGGLFAHDPELEALSVSAASLDGIAALAGNDCLIQDGGLFMSAAAALIS